MSKYEQKCGLASRLPSVGKVMSNPNQAGATRQFSFCIETHMGTESRRETSSGGIRGGQGEMELF